MSAILLAVLASLANATGDVLQRDSARGGPSRPEHSLALLQRLLARRRWLAGVAVSLGGLALHTGALAVGEISAVQPVLVAELPLAVAGSALLGRRGLSRAQWAALVALAAVLGVLLVSLAPAGGDRLAVTPTTWWVGIGIGLALAAAALVLGWRLPGQARAALFGAAAGVGYGLTGVFLSVAGARVVAAGLPAALVSWQSWAALAAGTLSFVALQNALAAGPLFAVEPGLTLANPLLAVAWGVWVFHEHPRAGPAALAGAVAGAAVLVLGVLILARHLRAQDEPASPPPRPDDGRCAALDPVPAVSEVPS